MNTILLNTSSVRTLQFASVRTTRASPWTPLSVATGNFNFNSRSIFSKQQTKKKKIESPKTKIRSPTTTITMQYVVPAVDRVVAVLGYVLPFFNGLQYGRYFFMQYPKAQLLFDPIIPLVQTYQSIPYASFIAFFALYLGVVRNPSGIFSPYVRFNAMQAVVVDVLLSLPMIFERILSPRRGLAFNIFLLAYDAVFICIVLGFVYAVANCVLGRTPRLPFVADAADAQL